MSHLVWLVVVVAVAEHGLKVKDAFVCICIFLVRQLLLNHRQINRILRSTNQTLVCNHVKPVV